VGPKGAGTSTALDRLGLTPLQTRAPTAGATSPANPFELWCSGDAAVVDVAAQTIGAQEHDTWLALLDAVRRLRGHQAIQGVIVTLGISDLQSAVDSDLQELASTVRARLDEVLERLGTIVPVYLVLTKADLLPGFTEFWGQDPKREESAWGASFSVGDDTAIHEPGKAVHREFEVLADALHARLLERLPHEGDPQRRVRVLRFPLEFRAMEGPVQRFTEALCRPGPAPERFVLRGFYLTSQGEPRSKGYFLTDLLRSVVLPDRNLGAPTASATRRRAKTEVVAAAVSMGALALVLLPALVSYAHDTELARAAESAAVAVNGAGPETTPGMKGDPIEPALDALERLEADAHSFAIPGWFGHRAAGELPDALTDAYVGRIHAWMVYRLRAELEKRLDAMVWGAPLTDTPSTPDDRTPLLEAYDTLRLCAALADPKGHVAGDWAAHRLADEWRKVLPDAGVVDTARLVEHAHRYLAAMETRPAMAWPLTAKLTDARNRLKHLQAGDMPYRRMLLWAQTEPPVRASDLFGHASLEFLDSRGDVQIPGVFTARGWQKIREALKSSNPWPADAVVEPWVLDDPGIPSDERGLREQARQRYFDDYSDRWMRFLGELRIKTPGDVDTARRELTAFKAETFYKTLFAQLKQNIIRDDLDGPGGDAGTWMSRIPWIGKSGDTDAAAAAAGPSPVETAFRPILTFAGLTDDAKASGGGAVPLDKYLAILDALKADLGESGGGAAPKSLEEVQSHLSQAKTGVQELLDAVPDPSKRTLARLLMPPVTGGVAAGSSAGENSLSDDWKSIVWTAWDQKLNGHYPFKVGPSAQPASFADFSKFFRPDGDGILWGFVHAKLANMVEQKGDGAYGSKGGGDTLAPDALQCLTVAQEITDAFFRVGDAPGLTFSIQADWTSPDVTDAKFFAGAKGNDLPKASWSAPLKWLGEDVHVEWKEGGRPTQELGRHSFSLFDLFAHLGGLKAQSAGRALYSADCPPLTLKVRPEGKDAFRPDFFTRLHCPQTLRIASQ
jgi:type VI secretion system protein ImpL